MKRRQAKQPNLDPAQWKAARIARSHNLYLLFGPTRWEVFSRNTGDRVGTMEPYGPGYTAKGRKGVGDFDKAMRDIAESAHGRG